MNKIALIITMLLTVPAYSSCIINDGIYVNFGGSEYSARLELLDNGIFNQEYETWSPGEKDKSEKTTARGRWTCQDNRIELKVGNKTHSSIITRVGENPLDINENVVLLHFEEGDFEYLSREVLYPISVLKYK